MSQKKKKSERVKNPNPLPEGERAKPRVKAGAEGSPVALPGDPETAEEKTSESE